MERRMHTLAQRPPANLHDLFEGPRPDRTEAEQAVRTLIRWLGDDPERDGLRETPARVLRGYEEWFAGYAQDPAEHLSRTFEEADGYDEPVVLRDIPFRSCCEHHMAPIAGLAHIGYLPAGRVVGLSKLARAVDCIAKRLQIQERMTVQIACVIEQVLQPRGVAVVIEASHACMSSRGVHKHGVTTRTSRMLGAFKQNPVLRREFLDSLRDRPAPILAGTCP
jgi:GTP cyclohydrolase IA